MRTSAAAFIVFCLAWPAAAQTVNLRFHGGLVNLTTQNAPLRTIFAEWARLGRTTVTNAERLAGPPVTVELNDVTERDAINVLLRNVAGYMAAPRSTWTDGVSYFDRIFILPTSNAPRNPPPAPARPAPAPRPQPELGPEDLLEDAIDSPLQPQPGAPMGRPRQPMAPVPNQIPDGVEDPPDPAPTPAPNNPFGIPTGITTTRPGVVTPVPQQPPGRTQPDPEP